MVKIALTDLTIKKLRPPENGRLEIADGRFPGLSIRVSKHGIKTFAIRTRVNGRQLRLSLGRYPEMSLSDARTMAHQVVAEARAGKEPGLKKPQVEKSYIFENVVGTYLERHCKRYMKERTYNETARVLNVEFTNKWGNQDIRRIAKQDVVKVTNDIFNRPQQDQKKNTIKSESPSAANHAFGAVRALFNWCVGQGLLDISPCTGLRSPAPKKKRDRVLDDGELTAVWNAAAEMGYPYGNIIQLLIVTVQRRSEVAGLRWDMLDLNERVWRVPAEENKSGREYLVPLSDLTIDIIKKVPRIDERLIFPAQRSDGSVFAGWSKCKIRIDKLSGVSNWTVHDLRRTGSTNLARLGVAPHIKERVLNHLTGELGGVAGVYDVYSYLPEKREALDKWTEYVKLLVMDREQ